MSMAIRTVANFGLEGDTPIGLMTVRSQKV